MIRALGTCCLAALLPLPLLHADRDFNEAIASVESAYHVHRQHIQLIGLASFCTHVASGGAIKGVRIAVFDDEAKLPAGADLAALLKEALGSQWSLTVETRNSKGEQDAVYVHPHARRMTLLIASYAAGELSIVRADMDAEHLRRWMHDPAGHARHPETD